MALSALDLYFKDPQEPLRLFKELEEENLFLIQNAHETVTVGPSQRQKRSPYLMFCKRYNRHIRCSHGRRCHSMTQYSRNIGKKFLWLLDHFYM